MLGILLFILLLPPVLLLTFDSALRTLYLLFVPRSARGREDHPIAATEGRGPRLAVLIAARDEADVIGMTVEYAQRKMGSSDAIFVVADNCSDTTAEVATHADAHVYRRRGGAAGKGPALAWLVEVAHDELSRFDGLVVLDADTLVREDFFDALRQALTDGTDVAQGFVHPIGIEQSLVSTLAGYSELLSQYIDDAARSRLGWPVPLRGTGMVFRPGVFIDLTPALRTHVEDAELSLLLVARGVRAKFIPEAVILDPKPQDAARAAKQRARWLQSQREIWRCYWRDILHLLVRGDIGSKTLAFSLLFKPKALLFCLKIMFLALFLAIPVTPGWFRIGVIISLASAVLLDTTYYILGLAVVENPRFFAKALLAAPFYVVVWLRGMVIALLSREPWLRARD